MSKDVVIAGVIVAACLGLVTVAFVVPKQKTVAPEIAKKDDPLPPAVDPLTPSLPGDPLLATKDSPPIGPDPFAPSPNPFDPKNTTQYPPTSNGGKFPPLQPQNPFPPINQPPEKPIDPSPKPETSEAKTHVVASGETLGEISAKYYGTAKNWKKIAEANKVGESDLKVGQKLIIPAIEAPATPAPNVAPELAGGERSYTVQKNDSYYSIAKKELGNASRWKEIEKLNNIASEDLHVGKVIKLPAKAATVEALKPAPEAPAAGDANVHVVKSGETLSDISKQHYGTTTKWKEIIKANPGVDPEGLKVGQKLKLPEIAGTTPAPSTGSSGTGTSGAGFGSPSTSAPASNPAATYTVKAGEYLEDIAQSQLGSRGAWKKIVDANPGIDPKKLRVGQKLVIPGKSAPVKTTPPPAPPAPPAFGTPSGFGSQPSGNGFGTPSGFGSQPSGSKPPSGFGSQPPSSQPPAGFGPQPSPSGFGTPPSNSFGTQPTPGGSSYPLPPSSTPTGSGSPSGFAPAPAPSNDNPFATGGSTRPVP
ncbi:MAG TPA: LysM peptidoglycan-binding domain-containing protein [Planctomycetota bacterium]|nr:LysM peptidoglycan-binding domain-containing protein [Planctomycetota bacterium]